MKAWLMVAVLILLPGIFRADENSSLACPEPEIRAEDRQFWAFQPLKRPEVPAFSEKPIDAFIISQLQAIGIPGLAPAADPETLLRRLSFQILGLPPSPRDRDRFLAAFAVDPEKALRETIDDFLSRPEYGENWALHWLDVARFAESDGYEFDKTRSEAWKYRDWVIAALNAGLPYDRFVSLQIAGDQLEPENPDCRVATGFLLAGPDMPDINLAEERRHNVLNELTSAVGSAFLGLTMECAQCHDHKSDPLSQADFYRLRAVFEEFALPTKGASLPVIFPVSAGPPGRSFLYLRGDFRRPGPEVAPSFPRILSKTPGESTAITSRAALARWLTRPDHPLTSRVMVNRIWQHHFGAPLAGTPSDFGKLGERPSHPELLDWLAAEFIRRGWSMKEMHREILLSRAWRQASRRAEGETEEDWDARLKADPDNRWLSRQRRQRLGGEAIRDAMLSVSASLNPLRGGPGVRPPLPPEVTSTLLAKQWPVTEDPREHVRRSIYLSARRNLRYPFFEVFDRPDPNQSCARRHVSTTAPQALTLLNDRFVWEMAQAAAKKARSEGETGEKAIASAYRDVLGRNPLPSEALAAADFISAQSLEHFFLALFNMNEFLYID